MNNQSYWLRQLPDTPLFQDILWSRPENKTQGGRLLIVGGNSYGFAAPATAYSQAIDANIGTARVLLPNSLQRTVGQHLPDADFAPINPSGSFAATALEPLLQHASQADAVLCAGDFGRNSETAVVLEKFATRWRGQLAVTQDAADYFIKVPLLLLNREHTALFVSFEQLQKFAMHARYQQPLMFSMDIVRSVDWLHDFSLAYPNCSVTTVHSGQLVVAYDGIVVTHPHAPDDMIWRVKTAGRGTVFWLQNPTKPLEAIASSFV